MELEELRQAYFAALDDHIQQQSETRKLSVGKNLLEFSAQLNAEDAALERYTSARNAFVAALHS